MRGIAGPVARLLDRLGLERVDVPGGSWGGALAQELARRHPDRVRRLVLAAPSPGLIAVPGDPRVLLRMATPLRYWSRPYFERVAPVLYGGGVPAGPAVLLPRGGGRAPPPGPAPPGPPGARGPGHRGWPPPR